MKQVSSKTWEYNHQPDGRFEGVKIEGQKLVWFMSNKNSLHAGEGASSQDFGAFLKLGPPFEDVPEDVVAEVRMHLEEHL